MTEKDKAEFQLKIAREEYGEPDFVPTLTLAIIIITIFVAGALIWYLGG